MPALRLFAFGVHEDVTNADAEILAELCQVVKWHALDSIVDQPLHCADTGARLIRDRAYAKPPAAGPDATLFDNDTKPTVHFHTSTLYDK